MIFRSDILMGEKQEQEFENIEIPEDKEVFKLRNELMIKIIEDFISR